jgi:endonuclease YncB( thermonuclease family)
MIGTWANSCRCSCAPVVLLLLLLSISASAGAAVLSSYAFVNEDGTLRIRSRTVHLYGIYLPDTGRHCRSNQLPMFCGSRAALALEFKIKGFVRCEIIERNPDRSVTAVCRVNYSAFDEGDDLGAYLLERGWALALPDAPFEYHALERIARSRGVGVWGISIDRPILPAP